MLQSLIHKKDPLAIRLWPQTLSSRCFPRTARQSTNISTRVKVEWRMEELKDF